jgi:cell division protein FtsW (lipid II flippase)
VIFFGCIASVVLIWAVLLAMSDEGTMSYYAGYVMVMVTVAGGMWVLFTNV